MVVLEGRQWFGQLEEGWTRDTSAAPWLPRSGRGTGIEDAVTHLETRVVATASSIGRVVIVRDGEDGGRLVEIAPHLADVLAWPTMRTVAEWWRMELKVAGDGS